MRKDTPGIVNQALEAAVNSSLLTPNSSLYFGEGGPLAVDEVIPPDIIRF